MGPGTEGRKSVVSSSWSSSVRERRAYLFPQLKGLRNRLASELFPVSFAAINSDPLINSTEERNQEGGAEPF